MRVPAPPCDSAAGTVCCRIGNFRILSLCAGWAMTVQDAGLVPEHFFPTGRARTGCPWNLERGVVEGRGQNACLVRRRWSVADDAQICLVFDPFWGLLRGTIHLFA